MTQKDGFLNPTFYGGFHPVTGRIEKSNTSLSQDRLVRAGVARMFESNDAPRCCHEGHPGGISFRLVKLRDGDGRAGDDRHALPCA